MKKNVGFIQEQKFLTDEVIQITSSKKITVKVYLLKIENEKNNLYYKRDKNLPQDMTGKKLSYYKTKDNLIYKSKVLTVK
jgi:hypothetical protein